ncbi:MAG: hypothetical protein HQ453_00300 [Actinobacteria bacterium]|nr:hypothetical protein [Actinomycetota bacterium]
MALAHNERTGAQTRVRVLLNLGRKDGLDTDGLRRPVSPVPRFPGDADPYAAGGGERADLLCMTGSRSMGRVCMLDGLWKQPGIDAAPRKLLGPRRFSTDAQRVLFALVANRALDPSSKLAASQWAERDAAIGGVDSMSEDQAFRAMDLLIDATATARVREAVIFTVANLLDLRTLRAAVRTLRMGSPPRVRGADVHTHCAVICEGITPARAESSGSIAPSSCDTPSNCEFPAVTPRLSNRDTDCERPISAIVLSAVSVAVGSGVSRINECRFRIECPIRIS